ncbi:hypothetical protein [Streptomonospora alba]|uniref:hypothetical protein n=1 Tax=Streptomonospora alba TaxID=183763 RepID=UPI0012EE518F|nr:hypothetical protein [Streptomonospora alba]
MQANSKFIGSSPSPNPRVQGAGAAGAADVPPGAPRAIASRRAARGLAIAARPAGVAGIS